VAFFFGTEIYGGFKWKICIIKNRSICRILVNIQDNAGLRD